VIAIASEQARDAAATTASPTAPSPTVPVTGEQSKVLRGFVKSTGLRMISSPD
jgi:hypothetical protein